MAPPKTASVPDLFLQAPEPLAAGLADIALALPIDGPFTYRIPAALEAGLQPGVRVRVPFKNQEAEGYVVALRRDAPQLRLKTILECLDEKPVLSAGLLELTRWVALRYGAGWGEAIENALPKWVKSGSRARKALAKGKEEIVSAAEILPAKALQLSAEQQAALDAIRQAMDGPEKKPVLLHGVTGSGKSEVYIRAIHEAVKRGQTAICLVPEIALTEQIRRFFAAHFGNQLEILHSRLGDTERFLAWTRIREGKKRVVLGPRSAVFAPLERLGLIILDEEHEGSYKQDNSPRYHVREVAEKRAAMEGAVFVMGSATPSLEIVQRAKQGEVTRVELKSRIDGRPMPAVQIIDMKEERNIQKRAVILSRKLAAEIEINLQKQEGTLLLLNRRGFSTHIQCPSCGFAEVCTLCQVSLTYHQEENVLLCHYCNFRKDMSDKCSDCGTGLMNLVGFGTEKVESEVARRWPQARILRLDADTVRKKGSHEEILKTFRAQEADILIGTQMIAKGFDFPHVTLVGVILADVGLMLPDFRSAERTFQLLTQVAGRAGRGAKAGRVIIQTFSPEHPSIRFAQKHDSASFYKFEMPVRADYRYPPTVRLVNIMVRGRDERKAHQHAREIREFLQERLQIKKENLPPGHFPEIEIIGPAPLPFFKLRGHYRWHVMLKMSLSMAAGNGLSTSGGKPFPAEVFREVLKLKKPSAVFSAVDIDPVSIL